jgi:hypothetical protein
MSSFIKHFHSRFLLLLTLGLTCGIMATRTASAQDGVVTAYITGKLEGINTDGTIVIDGAVYQLGQGVVLSPSLPIGTVITVTAQVNPTANTIIIISITTSAAPTPTPISTNPPATAPATQDASPDVIIIIEGPIKKIKINIITVLDTDVVLALDNPMLKLIKVGDFVRVRGKYDPKGAFVALLVSNISDPINSATVALNGKVEAIKGPLVVVNGINVQFTPNHPLFAKLKVGNVVNVEGNFQNNGPTVVLIVVNIVVINSNVTVVNPAPLLNCKKSKKGHIKCSKKKK